MSITIYCSFWNSTELYVGISLAKLYVGISLANSNNRVLEISNQNRISTDIILHQSGTDGTSVWD